MNITNLLLAKALIYEELDFSELKIQKESNEYEACSFLLNNKLVIYRTAKITPKKIGQFVAVWKRNELGITTPYCINDNFDLMIISVRTIDHFGQFIFSKLALLENGIISSDFKEGKRGFRLYCSWDEVVNKQALKTQKWQSKYFINLSESEDINLGKFKILLNCSV